MKIRKILVAVKKLEDKALPAVLKAAQIARAAGAEIELFHAISEPLYVDMTAFGGLGAERLQESVLIRARTKLERIAERLRVHSIPVKVSVNWDFPAYEAIVRRALAAKVDLIVADRYAGRHAAAGLLHLTDWELVKTSPLPVLLVKSPRPYRHPAILAAVDPSHRFAKTDQLDQAILQAGGFMSRHLRGKLHAVHVYESISPVAYAPGAVSVDGQLISVLDREARRAASQRLKRVLRASRIAQNRRYLTKGWAPTAITAAARQSRAAIVVMGAVSRSGIKRLLIGNTAERILDELACDILVIKPASFRARVPAAMRGARLRVWAPSNMIGYY